MTLHLLAAQHFSHEDLVSLTIAVIGINAGNHMALAYHTPVGGAR